MIVAVKADDLSNNTKGTYSNENSKLSKFLSIYTRNQDFIFPTEDYYFTLKYRVFRFLKNDQGSLAQFLFF